MEHRSYALLDEAIGSLSACVSSCDGDSAPRIVPEEPGQGGIVLINFNEPAGNAYAVDYQRQIERVAGAGKVQLIGGAFENEGLYPFLRNLAIEAKGVVLGSGFCSVSSQERMRRIIESYCRQNGIPYRRLANEFNFANVEYVPSRDLLIIASSSNSFVGKAARDELCAAFAHPTHVLHVELDRKLQNLHGGAGCYDLDLALHMTRDANGHPVALVYPECLRFHPDLASHGRQDFLLALHRLGIKLVEVSKADQNKLATNAISWGLPPGEILLPYHQVSEKFKRELQAAGVRPHFPQGGNYLGGMLNDSTYIGLHCLTLHLPSGSKNGALQTEAATSPPARP